MIAWTTSPRRADHAEQLAEKVARMATQTHKDRVAEFNAKLEALSEHHDIPKVSFMSLYNTTFGLTCHVIQVGPG